MKRWPCRSWKKRTQPVIACSVARISSDTGSIRTCRLPANGLCVGTRPCAPAPPVFAAAELRALARHARARQAHRCRLARRRRPAHGNRNAGRIVRCRARRFDQLGRRAPVAGRRGRRVALAQQVLDVMGIDQDGAGDAHHHQRQQQDQADPEMELLQPVAERSALRLASLGHRDLGLSARKKGWRWLARWKEDQPAPSARAIWLVTSAAA